MLCWCFAEKKVHLAFFFSLFDREKMCRNCCFFIYFFYYSTIVVNFLLIGNSVDAVSCVRPGNKLLHSCSHIPFPLHHTLLFHFQNSSSASLSEECDERGETPPVPPLTCDTLPSQCTAEGSSSGNQVGISPHLASPALT